MRIGIDLGGTKIELLVLADSGEEVWRKRIATPKENYSEIIRAITQLVLEAEKYISRSVSIGVGTPGSISAKTGLLRNSNSVCLNGQPFKADLESALQREVRISNDANCFALSEAVDGAGKGASSVFGVIVGTGCGAGVVVNNTAIEGRNAIGGEWGHNPLPWPEADEVGARQCWCGRQDCIETYISGVGLSVSYEKEAGQSLCAEQIVALAESGDLQAERSLQRYERRMAKSLAHVINILDPEVIVLGGGMSNVKRLYHNVPEIWSEYIFSDDVATRLLAPAHGDSGGVRGAAWLWERGD